ncbi:hypothetical protein EDD18DRAFT_1108192 [Armillaria luteobubalina]|uniref:Uncharacterized protein n=1 Tax=Armillaria luteobubalina TaxID=153913 RepID=A0AA39PZF6_9AGAR|nr:hypothetical protein EDD18DRAFT_1108192 [Armillaria luteobubalina]
MKVCRSSFCWWFGFGRVLIADPDRGGHRWERSLMEEGGERRPFVWSAENVLWKIFPQYGDSNVTVKNWMMVFPQIFKFQDDEVDYICMDCHLGNGQPLPQQMVLDPIPGGLDTVLGPRSRYSILRDISDTPTHQGFVEPVAARIMESGRVSSPSESSSMEKISVDSVSYPSIGNQEETPHILSPELSMKGDRGDESAAPICSSAGTNRLSKDTGHEQRNYHMELNNLHLQAGWEVVFEDSFNG